VDAKRGSAIMVILLVGLVLAWLVLDMAGGPNPVRDYAMRVLSPVQYALQSLARPVSHAMGGASDMAHLQAELEAARLEIGELRSQVILLQEAKIENEILRRELAFKNTATEGHILAAEVIGYDTNEFLHYLIVDRGEADGIEVRMPVVTSEGLVGRIAETTTYASKVMLLTDPSSSVSARIQRSRGTGIVQGAPGGELLMKYIPQENPVAVGDVVLTSGLGGNFPRRLPIGQITDIVKSDVGMFQVAHLVPAVDLRSLEMVSILMSFTPVDDWELGEEEPDLASAP
jgi:rod shape-determining protein MreC